MKALIKTAEKNGYKMGLFFAARHRMEYELNGGFIMTKNFNGKTYLDPKYDPAFKEL